MTEHHRLLIRTYDASSEDTPPPTVAQRTWLGEVIRREVEAQVQARLGPALWIGGLVAAALIGMTATSLLIELGR